MAETILRLQNISKYYYSDTSVTQALRKINLEFSMCEFVAITGESGGGKSTLLNVISGMDTFDEGEMYFRGEPTFQYDDQDWEEYRRNRIGFVFQDYSLINHYTALDNILAALVIQGKEPEEAKAEAMQYLEQVGLAELAQQKASQLSSGQKQRLSIARALAKDTEVIVADEPTGNLDSETGEQIVEILAQLSRERLVIMVTHNYEQAEPYVTRRIRLHDGEVVTDVPVRSREGEKRDEDDSADGDGGDEEGSGEAAAAPATEDASDESIRNFGQKNVQNAAPGKFHSGFFAWKNIRMQRGRAVFFFNFFLITAVVSFLFVGELLVYRDDRITKKYDSSAYLQQNDRRLVVRHPDNSVLTQKDQKAVQNVKYVEQVDLYDYMNDVNYYIEKDRDYKQVYGKKNSNLSKDAQDDATDAEKNQGIRLLDSSHFMKSATAITEEDLSAGRLPEARDEIVMYVKDQKKLNSEVTCYFSSDNLWEDGETCHQTLKIVGILKEKTEQVYFDPELGQMLTFEMDGFSTWMQFWFDEREGNYLGEVAPPCHILVNEDLEEGQVRISQYYELTSFGYGMIPNELDKAFVGKGVLHFQRSISEISEDAQATASADSAEDLKDENQTLLETAQEGEDSEMDLWKMDIQFSEKFSDQGADFLEVSPDIYQKMRDCYDAGTTQASVYIANYSKTEQVIDQLQELGYDAVSTFQVSTTKYVSEKVVRRLEIIGISCAVLLILAVLQILILRSVLKIKKKDYDILRFMGMRRRQLHRITYQEMGFHCIVSVAAALVIMVFLRAAGVPLVRNIMYYYSVIGVLSYILYNGVLYVLTIFFFHRSLREPRKV